MRNRATRIHLLRVVCLAALVCLNATAFAQKIDLSEEAYIKPPKEIADIVTAPRHLNVTYRNLGPDGEHFLTTKSSGMPTLEVYAKPFVNLGETEFDHLANRSRRLTLRRNVGFELFNYKTGEKTELKIPKDMWVSNPSWSPDGSQVAYFAHTDEATYIYVSDVDGGRAKRVTKPVLATMVSSFSWTADGAHILTILIPDKREPMPLPSVVASEPKVRMTNKGKTSTRTYPNLMQTPHDMELLEWLCTGQLALVNVKNRKVTEIGEPAMYRSVSVAPDGEYFRVTTNHPPFSYQAPASSAGSTESIIDINGKVVHEISKRELRIGSGGGGGRGARGGGQGGGNNMRSLSWRPDGEGMSFLQQEPRANRERGDRGGGEGAQRQRGRGGRGARTAQQTAEEEEPRKDRVMQWLPPYEEGAARVIYESDDRISGVQYSQDCQTLFFSGTEDGKRIMFAVDLADPSKKWIFSEAETGDDAEPTGSLMTKRGDKGGTVVRISTDGEYVFLSGTKNPKDPAVEGPSAFIRKVELKTAQTETIFESETVGVYETLSTPADDDLKVIFTTRQSSTMLSNSYMRNLEEGSLKKLTDNKDYAPEVTKAIRKRMIVKRVDGFTFLVKLTLPPNYQEGQKLPAMFWFYPREYTSQEAYDRGIARYNINTFPRVGVRSMEILTMLGYAVVQPDCPIFGEEGQMNNNYVQDLRNNLWAVIDHLDKEGYIDRDRLGIGGHSYGAFGTANAMIHTPFFKAGIAGDGNYNRTLTPMSFQSERRHIWDAREVYISMSPLFWANQLNGALLMYHGIDDANVGTFLINSERMFQVLDGLGKDAALYMYPYEHHGPATVETTLDLWARWIPWLDKYVMNPVEPEEEEEEKEEGDDNADRTAGQRGNRNR